MKRFFLLQAIFIEIATYWSSIRFYKSRREIGAFSVGKKCLKIQTNLTLFRFISKPNFNDENIVGFGNNLL